MSSSEGDPGSARAVFQLLNGLLDVLRAELGVGAAAAIDVLVTFVVAFAAWETAGPHAAEESFREAALWLG